MVDLFLKVLCGYSKKHPHSTDLRGKRTGGGKGGYPSVEVVGGKVNLWGGFLFFFSGEVVQVCVVHVNTLFF